MSESQAKWFPLKGFKCPVTGCKGADSRKNWVCATDSTPMYIAQTGYLRCSEIDLKGSVVHIDKISNWQFDCGNHGDHPVHRFKSPDLQGFSFALSHAVQLMGEAGATWVASLIIDLGIQYDRK